MDNIEKKLFLLKKNIKYTDSKIIFDSSSNDKINNMNNYNKMKTFSTEAESANNKYRSKNSQSKKFNYCNSSDSFHRVDDVHYKNHSIEDKQNYNINDSKNYINDSHNYINDSQNFINDSQNYNNNGKNYINEPNNDIPRIFSKKDDNKDDNKKKADINKNNYYLTRNKIIHQQKSQIEFNKLLKEIKDYTNDKPNKLYKEPEQEKEQYKYDNFNYLNDNNNDYSEFLDKKRKTDSNFYINIHQVENHHDNIKNNNYNNKYINKTNNGEYLSLYNNSVENQKYNTKINKNDYNITSYLDKNKISNNNKQNNNNTNNTSYINNYLSLSQKTNNILENKKDNNYSNYDLNNKNYNNIYNFENNKENNNIKTLNNKIIEYKYNANNYLESNDYSKDNNIFIRNDLDTNNYFEINDFPKDNNNEIYLKISRFDLTIENNEMNNYENKKLIKIYEKEIQRLNSKLNVANYKLKEFTKLLINNKNEINALKEELKKAKNYINNKLKYKKNNYTIFKKRKIFNNNSIIKRNTKSSSFNLKNNDFDDDIIQNDYKYSQKNTIAIDNSNNYIKKKNILFNSEVYRKKISKRTIRSNSQPNINNIGLINDIEITFDKNELKSQRTETKRNNNRLVYIIYPNIRNLRLLSFDIEKKQFTKNNFTDLGSFNKNFLESFRSDESQYNSIFLMHKIFLYIITGKNSDLFYIYNPLTNAINKLCKLKNNHANGVLVSCQDKLFCLSGKYNKKVEMYSENQKEWIELKEMNIERSFYSACVIKNKYIFCLFGYNTPTNKYLDTIEYYDINNDDKGWNYLKVNNINELKMNICGFMSINYKDEKIIIFGGINGIEENSVTSFYNINLGNEFENNSIIEDKQKKPKDISKNKYYYFVNGFGQFEDSNKKIYYAAYDNNYNVHIIYLDDVITHDIYYLNN